MRLSKLIVLMGICVTASSCSSGPIKVWRVAPELSPYVDYFYAKAKEHGRPLRKNLIVEFGDMPENAVGVCYYSGYRHPARVVIGTVDWAFMSELSRHQLIMHELGHCLLGRDHSNATTRLGPYLAPKTVMWESMFSDFYMQEFWDYYWAEIFSQ